jgi:hypothetical protein
MPRRTAFVLGALLALAAAAKADTNYANQVLQIGVGARALGMGGANVAVADDSSATYWNPAGLPGIKDVDLQIIQQATQNSTLALDTNGVGSQYTFVSGGWTPGSWGSLGLAIMRFGVSGIPQVSATTNADGSPNQEGTFSESDWAVLLGYGKQIIPGISAGLTAKILMGGTSGLTADASNGITGDSNYSYFGADLGVLVKFGAWVPALEGLNFGLNLQDVANGGVKWSSSSTSDQVDMNAKTGLAYTLPFDVLRDNGFKVTAALDADPEYSTLMHYGAELWYKETLALRAGVRDFTSGQQGSEVSYGLGLKLFKMIEFDYAYINYELTPIQYASLQLTF